MRVIPHRKPVIALQWDHATLDYLVAELHGGRTRIVATGNLPTESDDEEKLAPGQLLNAELARLGIRKAEAVVALNRRQVDVLPMELPPASDDELPTLVSNQVLRDGGDLAESGLIDFVALDDPEGQSRHVFAFVVESTVMDDVQQQCTAAGLKVTSVVYRALASVSLLQHLVPAADRVMVLVTLHDLEADLSIVQHGRLIFTRTARLSETRNLGELARQLSIEARRSLAAASLTVDAEQQHLYLFGSLEQSEQLVQQLADELALPASLLDPLQGFDATDVPPLELGRVAPLLGMVQSHFQQTQSVDFLNPKQPPTPPNIVRQAIGYVIVAAVLLTAGIYYLLDMRQQETAEIERMQASLKKVVVKLDKVKEKKAVVDAIDRWEADDVNWLDELFDIARRFPSGSDAMIRSLAAGPGRSGRCAIDMTVQVSDPKVITDFGDRLRDEYHSVSSQDVSEQASSKDYPWQFDTRIQLRKREVEQYRKEETQGAKPRQKIASDDRASIDTSFVRGGR